MTPRCSHPQLRRRHGRTFIIVLILLVVAGIGGYYAWQTYGGFSNAGPDKEILTATAFRGPFDHVVLEQGEVESSSNIDVNCEVKSRSGSTGGVPILWVIPEGTYVKEGDKLVELDSSMLENEIKAQRITVSSAEALVISSEATVRTAQIALQEYLEGTYMSERKTLLSEVALSEQELRKAELNLASAERLAAKGMIKGLQIEAEEFAVINAQNKLEAAEAKLKVLDELTKEKNKVQFTSDIEAAKAKLDSDRSVLLEEQEKLAELEDQIAKCVILSPAEGVVVYNNKFSSRGGSAEFVVEEGATVRERQTIIKLPDPTKMQVKANVNESRINLIGEGMAARVKVSAVPQPMLAKVIKVNKYAEPGSWFSSSVKEYATYIEIANPPPAIRTGMTAEVRIFVEQLDNALQIPVHGIYEYRGHYFCLVRQGEEWKTVEVEIGATNDEMVTIKSGLEEGDEVALNPRKHLDLMIFPEDIEEVVDRDALKQIGADAKAPAGVADGDESGGPPQGAGGPPGGGRPGAGGPPGAGGGAFNPSQVVDAMFSRSDADGDGKLSGDEISDRMKDRVPQWDKDGDGAISKSEAIEGMKSFSGGGQ